MRRFPLFWIFAIALLVATPAHALGPTVQDRGQDYRASFRALTGTNDGLQNSDGGFGPVVSLENGTVNATVPLPRALLQTVFTVHLFLSEDADIYDVRSNWEDESVSLAASNVSNALAWLRAFEAQHGDNLTLGESALLATAYDPLGDAGNARRVLVSLAQSDSLAPTDAAQLLFAYAIVAPETNASVNATFADLEAEVNATTFDNAYAMAWGLLAQPHRSDRRGELVEVMQGEHSLDAATTALVAWALAVSGGPDDATEAALVGLWDSAPVGLAQTWYLLAERTAHPEFSPHLVPPPVPTASAAAVIGSGAIRKLDEPANAAGDASPSAAPAGTSGNDRFPLPVWAMSAILLGALAVVVVTGLAYGLRREDLTGPRRDIFHYIENHPGEHFSKIRRDLGMAPGTFQHHLSILESEGWVTSFKDARYKRYFVNGNRYQKIIAGYTYKQKFAALANSTTRDLVRYVHQHPGVTQKQVAARLNIHASTVNWHVNRLKQAGILQDQRVGKEVRYTVDGELVGKVLEEQQSERQLVAA